MARYAVLDFETNGLMPDQGGRALADASMTAHLFLRMQADLAALYQGAETRPDFLSTYQKTVKTQLKFVPESPRARG